MTVLSVGEVVVVTIRIMIRKAVILENFQYF